MAQPVGTKSKSFNVAQCMQSTGASESIAIITAPAPAPPAIATTTEGSSNAISSSGNQICSRRPFIEPWESMANELWDTPHSIERVESKGGPSRSPDGAAGQQRLGRIRSQTTARLGVVVGAVAPINLQLPNRVAWPFCMATTLNRSLGDPLMRSKQSIDSAQSSSREGRSNLMSSLAGAS